MQDPDKKAARGALGVQNAGEALQHSAKCVDGCGFRSLDEQGERI
jgi:hypothetical protein